LKAQADESYLVLTSFVMDFLKFSVFELSTPDFR